MGWNSALLPAGHPGAVSKATRTRSLITRNTIMPRIPVPIRRTGGYLILFLVLAILGVSDSGDIDYSSSSGNNNNNTGSENVGSHHFFNGSSSQFLAGKIDGEEPQGLDLTHVQNLILLHQHGNRSKRQATGSIPLLSNPQNPNGNTVESLLASCQLTNLLLYQILQQKQAQIPNVGALGALGALGAIQQNLVQPYQETLTTYLSTTTFVTTMTTTALVTIPLLFGNKPVPTTITRTKVYDVTTSEILTLTSIIKPTITQTTPDPTALLLSTALVNPTPALQLDSLETDIDKFNESGQDESRENLKIKNRHLEAEEDVLLVPVKPSRSSSIATPDFSLKSSKIATVTDTGKQRGKRRKNRVQTAQASTPITRPKLKPKETARRGSTRASTREPAQYKILRDNRERTRTTPAHIEPQPPPEVVTQSPKYNYKQQYGNPRQQQPIQQDQPYYQDDYDQYGYTPEVPVKPPVSRGRKAPQNDYVERYPGYDTQLALDDADAYSGNAYDYNNYYARRLKRRGPAAVDSTESTSLDREYLLEPSFQGDYSQGYEQVEQCPPVPPSIVTSTVTETRTSTVTKYLTTTATPTVFTPSSRQYYNTDFAESQQEPRTTPRSRGRVRYRSTTPSTTQETYQAPEEYYPRRNIYRREYIST